MKNVDSTLAILTEDSAWFTENDIPVDDAFMTAFQVTKKPSRRVLQAVTMFVTFGSAITINSIKYNPNVWAQLNSSKIYMYPDKFDRQDTA